MEAINHDRKNLLPAFFYFYSDVQGHLVRVTVSNGPLPNSFIASFADGVQETYIKRQDGWYNPAAYDATRLSYLVDDLDMLLLSQQKNNLPRYFRLIIDDTPTNC